MTSNEIIKMFKCFVVISMCLVINSCSNNKFETKDMAIQVNKSKITIQEFNDLITFEAYADPEIDITNESKKQFINYLVRKEVMIQEASRLKLDNKNEFIKTIEKYWESTLISDLLDLKSDELRKKILITDDEIEEYYADNKSQFNEPLEKVRDQIKRNIESKKLETKMEEWVKELTDSAQVIVNNDLINQK